MSFHIPFQQFMILYVWDTNMNKNRHIVWRSRIKYSNYSFYISLMTLSIQLKPICLIPIEKNVLFLCQRSVIIVFAVIPVGHKINTPLCAFHDPTGHSQQPYLSNPAFVSCGKQASKQASKQATKYTIIIYPSFKWHIGLTII